MRLSLLVLALPATLAAQKADYHKADLIRTSARYVSGATATPNWLEDSVRFWFRSTGKEDRGVVYVVDPVKRSKDKLFDNARLAAALTLVSDTVLDYTKLPTFRITDTARTVEIDVRRKPYRCKVATYVCTALDSADVATERALKDGPTWAQRSPDKKWDVFAYRYNLYVRPSALSDSDAIASRDSVHRAAAQRGQKADTATGRGGGGGGGGRGDGRGGAARNDSLPLPKGSVQLTTDGVQRFAYGSELRDIPAEPVKPRPIRPGVVWGPDSKKLAIVRVDVRNVRTYPLYSSTKEQPIDHSYVYAAPGDTAYQRADVNIIDIIDHTNVRMNEAPSPSINFSPSPRWSKNCDRLFVMTSARGYKRMSILSVDPKTGTSTQVARDSFPTWVESKPFYVVNGGEDILWISERDGWAHIYRFGADGTLKNQVETGPYAVAAISKIDSVARQIYFTAYGRDGGVPYYQRLYRVNFDGSGLIPLTSEDASHAVTLVPKAPYFIDSYSRPDMPPITILRSAANGQQLLELARGDIELLRAVGWTAPEVFQVKARDGVTDLWGLMYKPSNFDPKKVYPIVDHIYPGPQVGSVSNWAFNVDGEPRGFAELGFIVIELDHEGTPKRSKAFHDFYFGNMGDNGIPDHITGIKQLAARYPWIDIDRVGIYGHSGGGFASTDAILRYPEFYKVAVSGSGNHDNRTYGIFWGEKYQGLLVKDPRTGKDNFEASANYTMAGNLKGKLLLMTGDMDNNVHPANTFRVVDALIKANKDFDFVMVPDASHGLPDYTIRRRWDYFLRNLLGVEPPAGYQMMTITPGLP